MSVFGKPSYQGRHRAERRRSRGQAIASAVALVGATGTLVVLPPLAGTSNALVPPAVTDVNPNAMPSALFGGRVERLAIDPVNTQKLFAATELGGLWRTDDGGAHWSHVDAVPMGVVQDVKIAAADPSLVVAVGNYEGSQVSQGGVWRSTDGGATWAKSAGSDPTCTSESNALTVAIGAGTPGSLPVFVGDSCGLTRSNSSAADNTWTRIDPDGSFDNTLGQTHQIEDVEVRPGAGGQLQVDVCGQQGFFRSNDSGGTWSAADPASPTFRPATSTGIQGGAFGVCNIDVAPNDPNTVYLSNFEGGTASGFCAGQLLESTDGGATWTQMGADVTDSNCRDPFVQVQDNPDGDATTYHVYFGTSVRTLRQTCDSDNAPSCATGAAAWPRWDSGTPHTDPTSIAFDPAQPSGCPLYLSGDGGVFRMTSSGCGATPTIVHANTGLHALDSSQMAGTVWPTHTDLYFGTQDNGTFYTADGGATYINNGPDTYNLIADREGNPNASVLRRDCFSCGVFRQPPGGTGNIAFNPPPAPWNSDFGPTFAGTQWAPLSYAVIARDSVPDNGVPPAEPAPNWAVFYTVDAGANWTRLGTANLPAGPTPGAGSGPGSHGQIKASGSAASPVFYLNLGGALFRLNGGVLDPTQATNAATLTQVSTGLTNVRAWDVDPTDPNRLYAVSRDGAQSLMRSVNGGASWTADPEITSLVTGNGAYKWSSSAGPMATAVTFDPYSDAILVGTRSNGIFASVNNGDTWITVPGSKTITWSLDFLFDNVRQTAFVGSRGRGLWRIDLPESDLRITKTGSPDPVIAGEQLTYTITVTNDGPDAAGDITVVDDLPPQVEFVTSSIPCAEETVADHDRVTCALPDLANGASTTFTMTVFVNRDAVSDHGEPLTIVNTAVVSSGVTVDRDASDNTATATTVVNDSADLELTKLCDPATLRAGQTAHCTVFVDNHGPSDARGVVISDTMLSDGTFTVSNIDAGPGAVCTPSTVAGGQRIECNVGVIAGESTAEAGRRTLTYDVTADDAQEIDNKARARSDTPDPDDTNNIKDTTIVVSAVADLSVVKTAPASAVAGTEFNYLLTVTNDGPSAAENVRVADDVPAGVTVVSVSGTGGATCVAGVPGNPLQPTTCSFGTLANDAVRSMTIRVRVDPGTLGVLHNDARATSDTFDPDTGDNLAHTATDVLTRADLSVTKSDSPDPVVAGTPISYTIRVSNAGPSVARDVAIVDALPGFVQFGSATIQHGSGTCTLVVGNPNEVRCQLGDLAAGDYVDVVIAGVVRSAAPSGVVLVNTVTVTSTTPDDVPGNNTAQTSSTVATRADLRLAHTSDALVYRPSTTIHYTITVVNDGPSDAANVVVTDQLPPAKFGYYLSDDGGCQLAGETLTCPGVTLAAGATRTILVKFYVKGSKGTIQATATATSDTFDPDTANNAQTRTVTRK